MEIRTFIAIPLPMEVKKELMGAQEKLKKTLALDVKWVSSESMHLTLKFLGDIDEGMIPSISGCMKESLKGRSRFEFEVKGLGVFPHFKKPLVIWAGTCNTGKNFKEMHAALDQNLETFGVPREEKEFHAHITLGRVKRGSGGREVEEIFKPYEPVSFGKAVADRAILFKSVLGPKGAVYTPLYELDLP